MQTCKREMETKRKDKETETCFIDTFEKNKQSEHIEVEVINLIYFSFIIYFLSAPAPVEIYS